MLVSLALLSVLSTAVYAQTSTSSGASAVPSGVSDGCATFLNKLNSDKTIDSCATTVLSASASYSPSNFTSSPTSSGITSVLNDVCKGSCDKSTVQSLLTEFYSSCKPELTTQAVESVRLDYDVLYMLIPFQNALCTKNAGGTYCVLQSTNSTSTDYSSVASSLTTTSNGITVPNPDTYASNNVPFLMLSGKSCDVCTTNIMSAYLDFEGSVPYSPGFGQSLLLSGQSALYKNITSNCGSGFLDGAVSAAGGISQGSSDNAGVPSARLGGSIGMIAGLLLVAVSLFC